MLNRVYSSGSYDEALCVIGEYVNITGSEQSESPDEGVQLHDA